MRGHVVVCGLGETGLEIVQGLRRGGEGVIPVTRDDNSEGVTSWERLGVPVLSGDASRLETLDHAGIRYARAVVASTGSDAVNFELAAAGRRVAGRTVPLLARPEIRASWLIDAVANRPGHTSNFGRSSTGLNLVAPGEPARPASL